MTQLTIVIAGGGAAGFFAALSTAHHFPQHRVIILEKTRQPLAKVRISGGGRCNVTHACFDPAHLVKFYPRGHQALRGPFTRFQPLNTIEWFEQRGVRLKTEEDGRMFPVTDDSQTIIDCFLNEAKKLHIDLQLERGIQSIERQNEQFIIRLSGEETLLCDRLLLATGSAPKTFTWLSSLGHTIVPLVPSLFTFNLPTSPLLDLAGISVSNVHVKLPAFELEQTGPLLLTHWGLSGPAVLKLSAWGARELHQVDYQTQVVVNWIPEWSEGDVKQQLLQVKREAGGRQVSTEALFELPKQLWRRLVMLAQIESEQKWASLTQGQLHQLMMQLRMTSLDIQGKTTYKQEFVTCGGVSLDEVNFRTMESRRCPGLYLAGEILNIDGVTGGFNFQNAWTTGWLAGQAIGY